MTIITCACAEIEVDGERHPDIKEASQQSFLFPFPGNQQSDKRLMANTQEDREID